MPPVPTVAPLDQFTDRPLVTGTVAGASVNLYVNGNWVAWSLSTSANTRVPIPHRLVPGDSVSARQSHGGVTSAQSASVKVEQNYVTHMYDNMRTGWNPYEPALSPGEVKIFQLQFKVQVDGQICAQPLFVQDVAIVGKGKYNTVFVATENDSVYAFNAERQMPALWHRSLIPAGERVVTAQPDLPNGKDPQGRCGNIAPNVGVTGTPVIDRATDSLFVVAKTTNVGPSPRPFHFRLYKLDLKDGSDQHPPAEIAGTVAGIAPNPDFDPRWNNQRAALLLANGLIYIAFASHCDELGTHGWLMAYDADTLAQQAIFSVTPDGDQGGIWQSGCGPAADAQGFVYAVTCNGGFDADTGGLDYGDTVMKMAPGLSVVDYFTPYNQAGMAASDQEVGSGGVMVVPDQPPPHTSLLVCCGKEGDIYLLDRTNLGGYSGPAGPDNCIQKLKTVGGGSGSPSDGGVWAGPCYYRGPTGQYIYYCADEGPLTSYALVAGSLSLDKQSAELFPALRLPAAVPHVDFNGGAIPVVSSNQSVADTGVVWVVRRGNPLQLMAYDATDITKKLFQAGAEAWDGGGAFMVPTVAHERVYVGSSGYLTVFGKPSFDFIALDGGWRPLVQSTRHVVGKSLEWALLSLRWAMQLLRDLNPWARRP